MPPEDFEKQQRRNLDEDPGFFERVRQRGEEMRIQQQAERERRAQQHGMRQQLQANNRGCTTAAIMCTFMICVTALIIAYWVYV